MGDFVWLSYTQDTFVVSFESFIPILKEQLKNLTRLRHEGHFEADLYHQLNKNSNLGHFRTAILSDPGSQCF